MPRVIISSGHTAQNPGTVANDLREYDVSRKISNAIMPFLRQSGVISLSVPPNMELFNRLEWINKAGYDKSLGDVAIEIHVNDGGKSGIEAWFEGEGNNQSQQLSNLVISEAANETGLQNHGAKSEYQHKLGSISFLHEANPITCLIECGYLDNSDDANFLKKEENIKKFGKGIAKGILKFMKVEFKEPAVSTTPKPTPAPKQTIPPSHQIKSSRANIYQGLPQAPPTIQPTSLATNMTTPMQKPNIPASFPPTMPNSQFPQQSPQGMSQMPSREQRKELIKKNYIKVLGREPNQNDLNYFINIGIKEDDLIKKMVNSQEHADLVKARQEVLKTKKKFNDQQLELETLRAADQDNTNITKQLNQSIQQKNFAIAQMQYKYNTILKQISDPQVKQKRTSKISKGYRGTFLDRLFKAFSDLFD